MEAGPEELKELYYDSKKGFLSHKKFLHRLRDLGYTNKSAQVKAWIQEQTPNEIMFRPHKRQKYNTIHARAPGEDYQMDIMYFKKHAIHHQQYILAIIDVNSRYVGARSLSSRKVKHYLPKLQEIIEQDFDGKWPRYLCCDNEFDTKELRELLGGGTELKLSQPYQSHKNAIVERFFRTLRGLLGRWRWGNQATDWPNELHNLIDNYNTTFHSTLKHTPLEVWTGKAKNEQIINFIPVSHRVGERVRVVDRKQAMGSLGVKTGERVLSQTVYEISKQKGYSWQIKDPETDEVLRDRRGKRKLFLDYELVTAIEGEGPTNEGEDVRSNQLNNAIQNRLTREDIFDREKNPFALEGVQLGILEMEADKDKEKEEEVREEERDQPSENEVEASQDHRPPSTHLWERGAIITADPWSIDQQRAQDNDVTLEDYNPTDWEWQPYVRQAPTPTVPPEPLNIGEKRKRKKRKSPKKKKRSRRK